jgi:hypothetical protein
MRRICHKITLSVEVPIGMMFEDGTEGTTPDLTERANGQFFVDVRGAKRIRAKTMREFVRKLEKDVEEMFW